MLSKPRIVILCDQALLVDWDWRNCDDSMKFRFVVQRVRIPPWRLNNKILDTITDYTIRIANSFKIKGPFNLQFLIKDDQVYVIELNIRASRSMPFVSKLVKINLISLASRAILGKQLPP